jgi:hypothetical protein
VTGVDSIHAIFANRGTRPLRVRGVAMYDADNTQFLDLTLDPGDTQQVFVAAAGTNWFDVIAVTREAVDAVRRVRLTCDFEDGNTPVEPAWSCIGTR